MIKTSGEKLATVGIFFAGILVASSWMGCSNESPKNVPLVKREIVKAVDTKFTFTPEVDILFVIDDSDRKSVV